MDLALEHLRARRDEARGSIEFYKDTIKRIKNGRDVTELSENLSAILHEKQQKEKMAVRLAESFDKAIALIEDWM